MKNILITNRYAGEPLEIVYELCPARFRLLFPSGEHGGCLDEQIKDADYLLVSGRLSITGDILSKAGRLKMIQRTGVGLEMLDMESIRQKGIPLYVNRGINAESVAEHTLLLILACLRRLINLDKNTKARIRSKQEQGVRTFELHGKTVGIFGMGQTARALVKLLKPFNTRILYYDPFQRSTDEGLQFCKFEELLTESDILTIHCPLTQETQGMINRHAIQKMKDGVVLINTARGKIINTKDLISALEAGKISYAALDVYEEEPPKDVLCFSGLDNIILTPHIAGVTNDSFRQMISRSFYNIACFDEGKPEEIEQYRMI